MERVRGARIGMVFQDPLTSLNPALTIGSQIAETILAHEDVSNAEADRRAVQLLEHVGVADAAARARDYPHHFSGGMRQRVLIAAAIACRPEIIIADEPTTALDVTVQAKILRLLHDLQQEMHASLLLITHDLGVVASMADDVLVMYAGRVVERADVDTLFHAPAPPVHAGAVGLHRRRGGRPACALGTHWRRAARPAQSALRLPVRPALPTRRTGVSRDRPATASRRAGAGRGVHSRGGAMADV